MGGEGLGRGPSESAAESRRSALPLKAAWQSPVYGQTPSRGFTRDIGLLLAAGALVRLYLIYRYPAIFGSDTIARLAHTDRVVLAHQLPLLQVGIHYLSALSQDPLLVRWYMAVLGAVAGVGFYFLMSDLVSRDTAFDAALLFTASPFILAHSVVPYQEILMLAGLGFAFHFAFVKRWPLASLCLGLACLTRYEAWLACPVLGLVYLRDSGWTGTALLRAAALFGWAPLAWIVYSGGLTPSGTHVLEASVNPERALRWAHLGVTTLRYSPVPVALLAVGGVWVVVKGRLWRRESLVMLAGFLGLFLLAILVTAPGIGQRPERMVTNREAHLMIVAVIVVAALCLEATPRFRHAITAVCVLVGLWMADTYVRRATAEPRVALSFRLGRYLEREVAAGERVAIIARATELEPYLAVVEQKSGPAAVRETVRLLDDLNMGRPPEFQRVRVHVRWGRERLVSYATPLLGRYAAADTSAGVSQVARPDWVVLWSDVTPTNAVEAGVIDETRALVPRQVFEQYGVTVRVYSLPPVDRR